MRMRQGDAPTRNFLRQGRRRVFQVSQRRRKGVIFEDGILAGVPCEWTASDLRSMCRLGVDDGGWWSTSRSKCLGGAQPLHPCPTQNVTGVAGNSNQDRRLSLAPISQPTAAPRRQVLIAHYELCIVS